ncbi:integral membrane protein [Colletotrichum eremochloae]|nr:integral membrane protein [Colletotrichum eremochloae]
MKGYNTSFSPLPLDLRHGLEAVVAFSGLSFVTSSTLLIYLIGRLALWFSRTSPKRLKSSTQTGNIVGLPQELGAQYHAHASKKQRGVPNQFLVLLLNLLLADILQSCAFFLSVIWLVEDSIISNSPACWVQGWLLSMGDFATNAFVAAIAVHTYLTLVRGIGIPCKVFYSVAILLWLFALLTSVLGVIITNNGAGAGGFYVRDGAWCWINAEYEILRVALHYIWMVLLIIAGIISYVSVFVHFHRKDKAMRETNNAAAAAQEAFADASLGLADLPPMLMRTDEKTDLKTRVIFLLYPLVFLLCTAPLALNHMMHSGGIKLSTEYLVLAGVMVSSNGWLDVLVFSTTRGSILFESPVDEQNVGIDTFKFTPMDQQYGYRVWIHGGPPRDSQTPGRTGLFQKSSYRPKLASESRHDRGESQTSLRARDLSGLEGIQLETVTHVFVEEADNKIIPMASEEPVGKRVQQSVDSWT